MHEKEPPARAADVQDGGPTISRPPENRVPNPMAKVKLSGILHKLDPASPRALVVRNGEIDS